jgi:hypothetical protein
MPFRVPGYPFFGSFLDSQRGSLLVTGRLGEASSGPTFGALGGRPPRLPRRERRSERSSSGAIGELFCFVGIISFKCFNGLLMDFYGSMDWLKGKS